MLSITMLTLECYYAECHYAECHYAECYYAECYYAECHYAESKCLKICGSFFVFQAFCSYMFSNFPCFLIKKS
jgi:hypothetical protein